ncbi:hypothetical protein DFH28DRAFT_1116782 [Melampsora americana]|nr:hypothetical protein DFH28DRAFT_1125440 [Melampsora americana]KAH9824662.1 hypothetical protein DFH28DRAFT_1116782 [Melampsora americana]
MIMNMIPSIFSSEKSSFVPIVGKEDVRAVAKSWDDHIDTTTTTNIEMIFLGTGKFFLETEPMRPCTCCNLAMAKSPDSPVLNKRRNTSAVNLFDPPTANGKETSTPKTTVIDVGASFRGAALEFFPANKLSKIGAVLLTHPHVASGLEIFLMNPWQI